MIFGMTPGEVALVVFIFALVYGALLLPRLGNALGAMFHRPAQGPKREASSEAKPKGDA